MMIAVTISQGSYVQAAGSAVMPWKSIDATATVTTRLNEPQENIDRCLRCECAECWNCIASLSKRARMRKEAWANGRMS